MSADTRGPLVAAAVLLALVLAGVGVCVEAARPAGPEPAQGVTLPAETLRALLHAQDERDALRDELSAEREARRLDAQRAEVDLQECRDLADARERARVACEASAGAAPCPRPWAGWPWVAAGAGLAVGVGVTVLAR